MNPPDTARRQFLALTSGPDHLRQIWDSFPLGVIITGPDDRVVYYNEAHSNLDGLSPEEVLGRLEHEVLVPISGPNIMAVCRKTGRSVQGYIFPYRTGKGRVVNAAYWVYPVLEGGRSIGAVCFTQPLLGELGRQARARPKEPIQWPGQAPISLPPKKTVGANPAFQRAVELAVDCAATPFPVLISGETGTGKEMLAKLVHRASPRRRGPCLTLNCSAIPGQLLEGLLFGTVKGSYTGAVDRPGLFEEAGGGCLYLDEIDSMPLDLQPKLLRAIQEMRISRVGSARETNLDLKIISSISTSPQAALSEGHLRADLFYRLAAVVITVPPLRERLDDLELLTNHFICKYNNLLGKSALKPTPELLAALSGYGWPGNVRELEHFITGALSLVKDENLVGLEHVPEHYHGLLGRPAAGPAAEKSGSRAAGQARRLMLEEEKLRAALSEAGGNISRAARALGLSRQLLTYRLMKFGLHPKGSS